MDKMRIISIKLHAFYCFQTIINHGIYFLYKTLNKTFPHTLMLSFILEFLKEE